MGLGKNPCLKRKPRGKRGDGKEGLIFKDDAALLLEFLSDDITEDTPVLIIEIVLSPSISSTTLPGRSEGRRVESGNAPEKPCCHAMVLKYENISEPLIILEIGNPVSVGCQDMCDPLERHGGQGFMVAGGFNDHFMGSDSVHLVVDPLAFTI
jgi:hypothetical protein